VAIFAKEDVCVEPVLRLDEAFEHPQCAAREMVVNVPKPKGGSQRQVGFPIKFSQIEPNYKHIGCALGEHTDEVLGAAGYDADRLAQMRDGGLFG